MVIPHADFAEITRVVFVEVNPMVVLTAGITLKPNAAHRFWFNWGDE